MNRRRRFFLIILFVFAIFCAHAYAATSGDWEYRISNGKAIITKYKGTETNITTPTELGGYPVREIGEKAFEVSSITKITISEGVTAIGDYAFTNSSLYSVAFPSSLIRIGNSAFSYCGSLTDIVLPEGVEEIGDFAFTKCYNSSNKHYTLTIPSTIRSMGDAAFKGCTFIETVNFSEGIQEIPYACFESCITIKELNLPESVTKIGNSAFNGCQMLTEVNLPDNITSIGINAFSNCTGLTKMKLPGRLTEISAGLLRDCRKLETVEIPKTVVSIGANAFCNCPALRRLVIPESVIQMKGNPITGCPDVELVLPENGRFRMSDGFLLSSDGVLIAGNGAKGNVIIPKGVKEIADSAFGNCDQITAVSVPDTVTAIGNEAFRFCYSLKEITVPDSVVRIGSNAFGGDDRLESVRLPEGLTRIESLTFSGCTSLKEIQIPQTVCFIGSSAFAYCSSLQDLIIPGAVQTIESGAFDMCSGLKNVYLYTGTNGHDNASIADRAFDGCTGMTIYAPINTYPYEWARNHNCKIADLDFEFSVENGKATIVRYLRTALTPGSVSIPDVIGGYPVTRIGKQAFKDRREMTGVRIPATVTVIEDEAFMSSGLETVGGNPLLGVYGVHLPAGLTEIGSNAFSFCQITGSVTIPDTVTRIGKDAFAANANLGPDVEIPGSVLDIGDGAFSDCPRIGNVYIDEGVQRIGKNVFSHANAVNIYLPDSLVAFGEGTPETILASTGATCYANVDSTVAKILGRAGIPFNDQKQMGNKYRYLFDGEKMTGLEVLQIGNFANEEVVLPQGVTKIASGALQGSVSVVIPDTVKEIEEGAFPRKKERLAVYCGSYALERVRALGYIFQGDIEETLWDKTYTYSILEHVRVTKGGGVPPTETEAGLSDALHCEVCGCFLEEQKELKPLGWLVSFETGVEGKTIESIRIQDGEIYVLPEYPYPWPEGRKFAGWTINEGEVPPDHSVVVNRNIIVRAVWEQIPEELPELDPADMLVPEGLKEIEEEAFANTSFEVIYLGNQVTAIGCGAFADCKKLRQILIPVSVTYIDSEAFRGCNSSLQIFGIPDSQAERFAEEYGFTFIGIATGK